MTQAETVRGYDDTDYLREMASGLISRKYGSVDEAAKTVLDEYGGSNVDRLRRKFREQNWHERGLSEYVEAQIASRGLIAKPAHIKVYERLLRKWEKPLPSISKLRGDARRMGMALTPQTSVALCVLASMLLLVSVSSGWISTEHASVGLLAGTFFTLVFWADRASQISTSKTAGLHLGGLSFLTVGLAAIFATAMPAAGYVLGSLYGTVATVVGMTTIGVYLTSRISFWRRRSGRPRSLEISSLIVAITLLSQIPTVLLVHDNLTAPSVAPVMVQAAIR